MKQQFISAFMALSSVAVGAATAVGGAALLCSDAIIRVVASVVPQSVGVWILTEPKQFAATLGVAGAVAAAVAVRSHFRAHAAALTAARTAQPVAPATLPAAAVAHTAYPTGPAS